MSTYEVRGIIDENPASATASDLFFACGDVIDRKHDSGELAIPVAVAEQLEFEQRHDSGLHRLFDRVRGAWQNRVGVVQNYAPVQLELEVVVPAYVAPVVPVDPVFLQYTPIETKPVAALSQDEKDARLLEVMARMGHEDVFAGFKGLDEVPSFKDKGVDYFLAGVDVDKECSMAPYIPRRVDPMVLAIMRSAPASWNLPGDKPENDRW